MRIPPPSPSGRALRDFLAWPVVFGVFWWLSVFVGLVAYGSYDGGLVFVFYGIVAAGYGVLFYLLVALPVFLMSAPPVDGRPVIKWTVALGATSVFVLAAIWWARWFVLLQVLPLLAMLVYELYLPGRTRAVVEV